MVTYDPSRVPIGKYARAIGVAVLWALYSVQGLAQVSPPGYPRAFDRAQEGAFWWLYDTIRAQPVPVQTTPTTPPSGGSTVGNTNISTRGSDVVISSRGSAAVGLPKPVVVDVEAKLVKSTVAGAVARAAGKIIPVVSTASAVYQLAKEISVIMDRDAAGNPIYREIVDGEVCTAGCSEYSTRAWFTTDLTATGWQLGAKAACNVSAVISDNWNPAMGPSKGVLVTDGTAVMCRVTNFFGTIGYTAGFITRATPPYDTTVTNELSASQFADRVMARNPLPDKLPPVIAEAINDGAKPEANRPEIKSPSTSQPLPSSTTTMPDGRTMTSSGTANITYAGDNITYNITNITNIHNPVTNTDEVTTVTTDEPTDEPDMCEKNPDLLACQKVDLDTPDGDIPKETHTITYSAENLGFAGGTCPANVMFKGAGMSSQVTLVNWSSHCSMIVTYAKPMILALATFAALMIIFAGRGPEV